MASKSPELLPESSNHLEFFIYLGLFFHSLNLKLGNLELDFISPFLLFRLQLICSLSLPSGSHLLSFSLLLVPSSSVHLSKLPSLLYPMSVVLLHTRQYLSTVNLYLLLPASKLESISMLATSSLILLINTSKLLPIFILKVILELTH